MAEFAISIGAKVSEYLVQPILIRPLRPLFCYKSIVDEFQREHEKLTLEQERVENAVKEAKNNALEICKRVDQWLVDVNLVRENGQCLLNKLKENKSSCFSIGWCSKGWTCQYQLRKQVWKNTNSFKKLSEKAGLLYPVAHSVDLRQHIGLPFSEDFVVLKSTDSALRAIIEALMEDGSNKIGLYGMRGIGKTTLVKQVVKEAERLKIFDRVVMVTVPETLEMIRSIQGTIADFLNLKLEQESEEGRASQLHQRLKNGEKILIIFDDVRKEFDLATVGVPPFGCKVLLTTHDSYVCNSMKTQQDILLDILSEDEAWTLLKTIAGVSDLLRMCDVARKAVTFCAGIPKVLVTVGKALRGKSLSQWEEVLQQLKDDKLRIVVDDLQKVNDKLSLRKERVKNEVVMAKNNAQVIEADVEKWLTDVERVMEDVEKLKNDLNQNNNCFGEWDGVMGKKTAEQTTIVKKLYEDGTFSRVSHPAAISRDMGLSSSKDFMLSKSVNSAFREIMAALQKDGVNIIGLYGMGGIGKTTLAKQVLKEVENFQIFDRVVMVTVSQTPEVRRIQGAMADFLNLELKQETEEGRAVQLSQRIKAEKILIILDDVWKRFDLATIGIFGDECKSSKILLTTRLRRVCNSMDTQVDVPLNLLSEEEAWDFFKKKAVLSDDSELNNVAKQVVGECKCLPIALATVGAALRNRSIDEWIEALQKLRDARLVDILEVGDDDKNAYKCLRLSYDYLKHSAETQAQFLLLLCSLFPEDHEIDMEDLTRCAFGMRLFHRVKSIEDARRKVRVTIQFLKDSGLLLDVDDNGCVKMHDVVRDVVSWIGGTESPEKRVFTVRDCSDLNDQTHRNSFKNCRAVSFLVDSIAELPNYELVCPKLEFLLIFGGREVKIQDGFFKHMKSLKVLDIRGQGEWIKCNFSVPQSFHGLTNLRSLSLRFCQCLNSYLLGELRKLEILSLIFSEIDCGLETMSELKNIRLLDLTMFDFKGMLPSNVIRNYLKLEELYAMGDYSFREWETERESSIIGERSNASLFELKPLPNLIILFTQIESVECVPFEFSFPNLQMYCIYVGGNFLSTWNRMDNIRKCGKALKLKGIEGWSLNAFTKLLPTVEDLDLRYARLGEGYENIIPSVDQKGFIDLTSLKLECCDGITCLVDTSVSPENDHHLIHTVSAVALPKLIELDISYMESLRALCHGPPPKHFLQKLENLNVYICDELETVFQIEVEEEENHCTSYVQRHEQMLKILRLRQLPELKNIWKGATRFVSLCNLTHVDISYCSKLKSIFSASLAQSLRQLHILQIENCSALEEVISVNAHENNQLYDFSHCFQNLRELRVKKCGKLKSIFPMSIVPPPRLHLPKLQQLQLGENAELEHVFGNQIEAEQLGDYFLPWRSLEVLEVGGCPKISTQYFVANILQAPTVKKLKRINLANILGVEEIMQLQREDGLGDNQILTFHMELYDLVDLKCIWRGPKKDICFSYLIHVTVRDCNRLKQLFTSAIAQSLEQLKWLSIEKCNELEQVIVMEDEQIHGEDVNGDHFDQSTNIILFPHLWFLTLKDLPRLETFCPATYNLMLPSLTWEYLTVLGCPKMSTELFLISQQRYTQTEEDCIYYEHEMWD